MPRHTEPDWIKVGETDPFFGVMGDHRYHVEQVNADLLDALYQAGETHIASVLQGLRAAEPGFAPASALDFGCGVGRHTLAMAARVGEVVGVDVSPGMIKQARAAADRHSIRNCSFAERIPEDGYYDWVHSFQVFQHIVPDRGYEIVRELLSRLNPDGICSLHFTLFREHRHVALQAGAFWRFDGTTANLLARRDIEGVGTIVLFDYDLNHLLALMIAEDVELRAVTMTEAGGHHGARLIGRKKASSLLIEPGLSYSVHGEHSFERFLIEGWSTVEDWGVWTSGRLATLRFRVPTELRQSHLLQLSGYPFLAPRHPRVTIDASINNGPAIPHVYTEANREEPLELPLHDIDARGMATVRLSIDEPASPVGCGMSADDWRELGFALHAIRLIPRP